MSDKRSIILNWAEAGCIERGKTQQALILAGGGPAQGDWLQFINRLLLWLASLALASGIIFFFAYNWDQMGRFVKFGLMQALMVAALFAYIKLRVDKLSSNAVLTAISLLIGALLALTGQIYQTGADPWQLFAIWGFVLTPLAIVSGSNSLWLLWLGLFNLALFLYLNIFRGIWGLFLSQEQWLWFFLLLNSVLWLGFEFGRVSKWLKAKSFGVCKRLPAQVCALLVMAAVSSLALSSIFDWRDNAGWGLLAYLVWMTCVYYYYRFRSFDLLILSVQALSLIIVVNAGLAWWLHDALEEGTFLLFSLTVIAMSAGGGIYLKRLHNKLQGEKEGG